MTPFFSKGCGSTQKGMDQLKSKGMDRLNKRVWIDSRRHWWSTLYHLLDFKLSYSVISTCLLFKENANDSKNSLKYQDEFDGPIEEESFEYDYEDFLQSQMPPSFNEIFQHCLLPTIESVKGHVGKLIICCIIFRISTQLCKFFHPFWQFDPFFLKY